MTRDSAGACFAWSERSPGRLEALDRAREGDLEAHIAKVSLRRTLHPMTADCLLTPSSEVI